MNKNTSRTITSAIVFLRAGNLGAAARSLSAEHRAGNRNTQSAVEAAISELGIGHLFARVNGALVAAG